MSNYRRMRSPTGAVQDIPLGFVEDRKGKGWTICPEPDLRPELSRTAVGRHAGRGALVLGAGPSMSMVDPLRLRSWSRAKNLVVWGVNDVYQCCGGAPFPGADYLLILDDNFWHTRRDAIRQYLVDSLRWRGDGTTTTLVLHFDPCDEAVGYQRIAVNMDATPDRAGPYQAGKFFNGHSSGIAAVQMAMHCGCSPIYLLGHDCQVAGGKTHGAGVRSGEELAAGYKQGRDMVPGYGVLAKHAGELGTRIVNLSPVSALECFERRSLDEVEAETKG